MARRSGLGSTGLDALLDDVEKKGKPLSESARLYRAKTNKPIIAVVRTKGGSGESHAVGAVLRKLERRGKKALVVSQHQNFQLAWYAGPENSGDHSHIIQDWSQFLAESSDEFATSKFNTVILCRGTTFGDPSTTFQEVAEFSGLVVLSVNLDVQDSIEPAFQLAQWIMESEPELGQKALILCWTCRANLTFPHQYVVMSIPEYVQGYLAGSIARTAPELATEAHLDREITQMFPE